MSDSELQLQINYRLMEQLSASERRFRTLVEDMRAVVFETDDGGCLSYLNAFWNELSGFDHSLALKHQLSEWASRSSDLSLLEKIHTGASSAVSGEIYLSFPNDVTCWLAIAWQRSDNGGGQGTLFDITQRKEIEQKLKVSVQESRKLSMVARQTDNLVIITDAHGKIEWVNGGFESTTGYSLSESVGHSPGSLLQGPETTPESVRSMRDAVERGEGFKVEVLNYNKKKQPYWVSIEAMPVYDDSGELTNHIAIERDITERRKNSRTVLAAKDAAEALAADRGLFVANMSHEIRTPLNAILGMSELLTAEDISGASRDLAEGIGDACKRLSTLVNDVLDYSRLNAEALPLESTPVYIHQRVESVCSMLQHEAERKGLVLSFEWGNDQPNAYSGMVLADGFRLEQVMTNLVGNAIKFTGVGRVQVILTQTLSADGWVDIGIIVRDTGIGLPTGNIGDLIQPFTQADPSTTRLFGGTGLGLAITGKLIEAMQGSFSGKNCEGFGAEFSVNLRFKSFAQKEPVVPVAELPPHAEFRLSEQHNSGVKTSVLVVEDNRTNQLVVRRQLEKMGCDVTIAENGKEACFAVQSHVYDVLLMDVQMPVLDGIEATRMIREMEKLSLTSHQDRLPIIALTAGALISDQNQCCAAGMDGFLSKPVTADKIREALETTIAKVRASRGTASADWIAGCGGYAGVAREYAALVKTCDEQLSLPPDVGPSPVWEKLVAEVPEDLFPL